MIRLSFYIFLCHRVSSSPYLYPRNETSSNEIHVLEKFFVALNTDYLRRYSARHITVVGETNDDLKLGESLLKNNPSIICREPEKCSYSEWFSRGSFVVIFLDDLSEKSFQRNNEILLKCKKCRILFIKGGIIHLEDVWLIFSMALRRNVSICEVAHVTNNGVELYTDFVGSNCATKVRLITVWRPGMSLENIHTWAFKFDKNRNGCPVSVSSLNFLPKIIIKKDKNGSLTIKGGREGRLLLAVAENLNFTLSLRYSSVENQVKFSRKMSIVNDVISGIADVGIGRIRPTNDRSDTVKFSIGYDDECITWGVPRLIDWSDDVVWDEFSWQVWTLVGLVFAVSLVVGEVQQYVNSPGSGERTGAGFVRIVLDSFSIHLGNPVVHVFTSAGGRFMLIAYLYYVTVMTTAYKSYLAAILATNEGTPLITDAEHIIKENLTVGGSLYEYEILKDQINHSKFTSKVLERFVVNNNTTESLTQLKYGGDYAFLTRLSLLDYHKLKMIGERKSITFDSLDSCVLTYRTVIVYEPNSWLQKPADKIIQRLTESGIMEYWDHDGISPNEMTASRNYEKFAENRSTHKFRTIFILYLSCIALCLITFFVELLTPRLRARKRR